MAERGEHLAGWRAGPCIQAVLGPGGRSLLVLQPPRAKHQALLKLFSLKSSQQGLEGGSMLLTGHREVREHVQGQPARRYWSQAGSGSCYNSVPHPPPPLPCPALRNPAGSAGQEEPPFTHTIISV